MKDEELMQQALEALEVATTPLAKDRQEVLRAQAALRERLAQPEQEPVAWGVFDGPNLHDVNFTKEEAHEMARLKGDGSVVKPLYTSTQPQMQPCAGRNCGSTNPNLHSAECFEDYEKSTGMAQPVKEPVAWRFTGIAGLKRYMTQKHYDAQTPETKKWYEPFRCANCTTPPPASKPLTDEEIEELCWTEMDRRLLSFARAIEAAHGIKE